MNEWLKELKIGDKIYQVERHPSMPNGKSLWKAEVTKIETNYIETVCERDNTLEWLLELTKKLANNHRTFNKVWTKNYYGPDGSINVEKYFEVG